MTDDSKTPASPTLDQFAAFVRDETAAYGAERAMSGISDSEHVSAMLGHITTHLPDADQKTVADTLLLACLFGFHVLNMRQFEGNPRQAMTCLLGCLALAAEHLRGDTGAPGPDLL